MVFDADSRGQIRDKSEEFCLWTPEASRVVYLFVVSRNAGLRITKVNPGEFSAPLLNPQMSVRKIPLVPISMWSPKLYDR